MADVTAVDEPSAVVPRPPDDSSPPDRPGPPPRRLVVSPLRILVAILVGAVAFLTLAGFAGRWWWVFDICADYRFQLVVLAGALAVAALALRRWPVAGVALAVFAVNAWLVAPLYLDHPPPAPPGAPVLTIEHLNLQAYPADLDAFRRRLKTDPADVIVLLETNNAWTEGLARLDIHGYQFATPGPGRADGGSIVVLSKVPVHDVRHPETPGLPFTSVEFSVDLDGRTVDVLGLHTLSPKNEARSNGRDAEFEAIAAWSAAQTGPALALGDFNSTPWSHAFRDLLGRTDLESSQDGFGFQPTWPVKEWPLRVPIDHSLHTPDFTVLDRTVGPGFGSSHGSLTVSYAFR